MTRVGSSRSAAATFDDAVIITRGWHMTEQIVHQSVDTLIRNWWLVALRGAVALIFGVLTVFRPAVTLSVLILLFGAYAIANGVFTVVAAIAKRHGESHWVSLLVSGVQATRRVVVACGRRFR